jgi:hypothetical protein
MSSYLTTSAAASTYQPIGSYLTDAPSDGNEYVRKNAAWAVASAGGGVAWGAITGTLSSQTDLQTALDDKLALAGGTMTGGLTLSATGIIFSDATTLTTAPAGSTLAADQLTAGVVTANPTTGPTASGDVLQYNGTDLVWAAGGGGGGLTISTLSNGATSTLNATAPTTGQALTYDGTDLVWASNTPPDNASTQLTFGVVTTNPTAGPTIADEVLTYDGTNLVWAPPVVVIPGKSVNNVDLDVGDYTLVIGDANNIINALGDGSSSGYQIKIPLDSSVAFPIGTEVLFTNITGTGFNYVIGVSGVTVVQTSNSLNPGMMRKAVKLDTDTWLISSQI